MLRDKMDVVLDNVGEGLGMPHDKMDVSLVVWGFDLEFSPI